MLTVRWRSLFAVLKNAWPMWLAVGGVAAAFAAGSILSWFLSPTLSAAVRYTGTMLQLLGLGMVAIGLGETRRLFRQPSLRAKIAGWFGRLAAAFTVPQPITGQASLLGAVRATLTGEGRLVSGVRPGAPLEERVSVLEENLDRLRDELDARIQRLRQELATMKENIQRETQNRELNDQKITRMIEEVSIGGLHLEIVGLSWLILGVVGTSIPNEIAAWLSLAG